MKEVGSTEGFVLAQGFVEAGEHTALIGPDGARRLLAELTADPDRLEVRPVEAYRNLLSALQPGWTMRVLQIFWPDTRPRLAFQGQVISWEGEGMSEGLALLQQGLLLHLQEAPLPFVRRTILEFSLPGGEEGLAWWEGLPGLVGPYGLQVRPLSAEEVEELARRIFNPDLE